MNANMDANGQRTPYFDGGLTKMNKGGRFPYMSTRNNNFSNRNMMGSLCVADGNTGKCATGESCSRSMEKELLGKYKNEKSDGTPKANSLLLEVAESKVQQLARLKAEKERVALEIAALEQQ